MAIKSKERKAINMVNLCKTINFYNQLAQNYSYYKDKNTFLSKKIRRAIFF